MYNMAGIGVRLFLFVFCALSCLHSTLGQVTSVRLVDNTGVVQRSYGRVEVQINNNWGTVCDDEWDNLDAAVICKMVGFDTGGQSFGGAFFGQGTGQILLDNVGCDGSETNINDCVKNNIGVTDCTHAEDAGVNCTVSEGVTPNPPSTTTTPSPIIVPSNCTGPPDPNLRLRASANAPAGMGIVEIRNSSGEWGTICDDDFDVRDAAVVCRALCFATTDPRPGALAQYITAGSPFPIAVDSINCTGSETTLTNCPRSAWGQHDCAPTEKASVTCVQLNSAPREAPVPRLDCREGYLVAAFNKSYDPNLDPKLLTVADQPNCTDATKQDANNFVTIKIPFTACGTQIRQNETHLFYSNTIKYDHTSYEGPITRVNTFLIGVTCEMARGNNITRQEVPLTAAVTQKAPGEFVITMKFYRNDSFTVEDTQNPLRLPIGEWLNVGLEMENVDSKLKLIVPTCRAYPFNNSTSVQYTLFENNCRNEPSLATFPFNSTKFGFRYQTFMFVNSPSVYVVCDTFVCLASDNTAVCDRSCNSSKPQPATTSPSPTSPAAGRRRRDVTDFSPRHFTVASAPVIVYRMDNTETVIERIGGDGTVLGTTVRVPVTVTEVTSTPTPASTPPPTPSPTSASTPRPATSTTPDPGSQQTKPPTTTTSSVQTTSTSAREATPSTTLRWEWAQGITSAPSRDTTPVTAGTTTPGPAILRDSNSMGAGVLRDPGQSQSQTMGEGGESIQRETLLLVPVRAASTRMFCSLAVVSLALLFALVLC